MDLLRDCETTRRFCLQLYTHLAAGWRSGARALRWVTSSSPSPATASQTRGRGEPMAYFNFDRMVFKLFLLDSETNSCFTKQKQTPLHIKFIFTF